MAFRSTSFARAGLTPIKDEGAQASTQVQWYGMICDAGLAGGQAPRIRPELHLGSKVGRRTSVSIINDH
jgi:hypothetical protein